MKHSSYNLQSNLCFHFLILSEQIRTMELQQLSCVILMILVTVALIDFFCSKIRFAIIGKQAL